MNQSEAVLFESDTFLEYLRRKNFVDKFGNTEMRFMKECLFDFPVAFVLQPESIYMEDISRKIQYLKVRMIFN